jgi:putative transposase
MINSIACIVSLLLTQGRYSAVKAADQYGFASHDQLTRALQKKGLTACCPRHLLPKDGYLVLDDTVIDKRHSKHIEGVSYCYSSSDHKVIPGLSFVLVIWVSGNKQYVVDVLHWKKGSLSKADMVRDLLQQLKDNNVQPNCVYFDAWYAASKTLNLLDSFGWRYVSRIKSNRYFNRQPVSPQRYFGAKAIRGRLKGVSHTVQIVKHEDRYLVTNQQAATYTTALARQYHCRWQIESIFRVLKSLLHVEDCACRSFKAQIAYVHCCLKAWFCLDRLFPDTGPELTQRQLIAQYQQPRSLPQQVVALCA